MAGRLFHSFSENGQELAVVSSNAFKMVGAGTSDWRRPGTAQLTEWQAMLARSWMRAIGYRGRARYRHRAAG